MSTVNQADKKISTSAPLFADNNGSKPKFTQGMKIVIVVLLLFVGVMLLVFNAVMSNPPSQTQDQQGRAAVISNSSTLQDELIRAAAEADRRARDAREVIVPPAPPVVAQQAQAPQVIVIQPPVQQTREQLEERPVRTLSQEERQVIQEYRQLKRQSLISESEVNSFNTLNAGAQTAPLAREDRLFEMLANSGGGRSGSQRPN